MLHRQVSAATLGLARIAVYGMWLWHVARDRFQDLADLPAELVQPIGVLRLLPVTAWEILCGRPALVTLRAALVVALAALVAGIGPFRPIAAATCVLLVAYQGLVRGVGYITHGELPMLYAAVVLAAFPCADGLALRPRPREAPAREPALYRAPMVACGLALCLTYALVGVRRLQAGGLEIFLDGTIVQQIVLRGAERGGAGLLLLEWPWLARLAEVGFPVVTAFEVLAPLALFHVWFRIPWLASMVVFHLATATLMNISFRANLVLALVFVTDIDRHLRTAARWVGWSWPPPAEHRPTP